MLFPVSMSGSVIVLSDAPADTAAVIRAVVFALEDAEPFYVSNDSDSIRFRAGPFRLVWNWNILLPISYGGITFSAEPHRVVIRYHVSFVEMFALTLIFCAVLCLFHWHIVALIFFLAGTASSYVGTWLRFPVLLRDAAEQALRLQHVREVA